MDLDTAVADTLVSEDVAVIVILAQKAFRLVVGMPFISKLMTTGLLALLLISQKLVKMDFLQQVGQNVNWFSTKKEIVKVSCSGIFLKITDEPVPV